MIETVIRDGKTWAKVAALKEYEHNPKSEVNKEEWARLDELLKLGDFDPLFVIVEDGTLLGGNTRIKKYREKGIQECTISPISFIEENDRWYAVLNGEVRNKPEHRFFISKGQAMLEYALADNESISKYDTEKVAKLAIPYQNVMPVKSYKINMGRSVDVKKLLDQLQPPDPNSLLPKKKDSYRLSFRFKPEDYQDVVQRVARVKAKLLLDDDTEVFFQLLQAWEENNLEETNKEEMTSANASE